MKPSLVKIGVSITLCTGLVVQGVGPIHTLTVSAKSSFDWLENSTAVIPYINEDDYSSAGVEVSNLLSGKVPYPEITGIAVVAVDNSNGAWQYFNTQANIWYNIEPVSDSGAFLLLKSMKIRFVPAKDWNGTASISYKLWDTTASSIYQNFQKNVNTAASAAFSLDPGIGIITVNPVNDAPYLTEMNGGDYLSFDGSGDYVTFPDLRLYGNSFTVEGFLKADGFNTWMRFFESSIAEQNHNIFLGFNGKRMHFIAYTNKGDVSVSEDFPIAKWVHVAIVYDHIQRKGRIYWDGVLKAEGPMDLSVVGNVARPNNWLGKSTWRQDGDYKGGMRDVRFWSKAKTQSEIAREMNVDLTGSEPDLALNYKLANKTDGNMAVNTLPNSGKNGSITGATWKQDTGFIGSTTTNKNKSVSRSFKVMDVEGDDLQVTATSSNTLLIPNTGLEVSGSGEMRTLKITPAVNAYGSSVITVTVNDGTLSSIYTFNVKVNDVGDIIVTGVKLDQENLELTAGEANGILNATIEPANATDKELIWSTSDERVATVVNGVVTPVGEGTAIITASTKDGSYKATSTVIVSAPIVDVTGVTIDEPTLSLTLGEGQGTLKATVAPVDATDKELIWSSSDDTVATVVNGVVTPIGVGTATITVTTKDGSYTANSTVIVSAPVVNVTGVTIDEPTLSLTLGEGGKTLEATVAPANATDKELIWSSSDDTVATVVNGVLTPVGVGTATITVTTKDGGYTATSTVNVSAPIVNVSGVTIDEPTLSLTLGEGQGTLKATVAPADATDKDLIWSTSDERVATVVNGVVTPIGVGTATITVTTKDGSYTATSTVTVSAPRVNVTGVKLDQETLELTAGEAAIILNATIQPADATDKELIWSTSDERVATVVNGVVTPVGEGTAIITVTTKDGSYTATSTVIVSAPIVDVTGVKLDQETLELTAGEAAVILNATIEPADATDKELIWSTSDKTVVTVVNGVVTPIGVGTATITVTTKDGSYTATSTVTVSAPIVNVTGVTIDEPTLSLTLEEGGKTLEATVAPANATDKEVIWSTSDETIATVVNGVVTPIGVGTATITVTTKDGSYTATSTVTVSAPIPPVVNVTGVKLDQETLNLTAGEVDGILKVTLEPADATDKDVTWSSSDESVASVVNGVVTPVGAGIATITVTTKDGSYTALTTVNVAAATPPTVIVSGVTLDQTTLDLTVGEGAETLHASVEPADASNKGVIWSTSDETVAKVVYGEVTPVGVGTAIITVTTKDGSYTASTTVTVKAPVKPVTAPGVPTNVTATAENGQTIITFTPPVYDGGGEITGYIVTANPGGITVSGTGRPIIISGLTNGTRYTFTVQAVNKAGVSEISTESNPVIAGASSGSEVVIPSQPTPSVTPSPVVNHASILINGKAETVGTTTNGKRNDQMLTTITLDQNKLEDKLASEGKGAIISISANTQTDVIVGELNGQMIKTMQGKQAVIEIKSGNATFTLPAGQIDIDTISAQLGKSVALRDIKIQVEVSSPTADKVSALEAAAQKGSFSLATTPVHFTVRGIYEDKNIELAPFNSYVKRTIAIPEGMDPNKITTGVYMDADGSVHHVPTKVEVIDGKYFATINSLSGGTFSVIWHPLEFSDVTNHWAKDSVNDMGSRLVIEGTGNGQFTPDQAITRAEFAAIVVRALGLELNEAATSFSDVKTTDWYNSAINTAFAYQLINGFEDGQFRPNDQITREQAMVIIAKAMKISGLQSKLSVQATDALLTPYTDARDASNWAINGIIDSLQAGVIMGRSEDGLAPKDDMTRAEVAAIVQRLLQKSDLI